ncbi:hypothetical protein GGI17_006795 [Coemansia sp. S146]|nr:hypothetical protein GGI17_006795 [Coemansia sp. S146]
MLNLIDPSLYLLIYDRSWLCRRSSTSPSAALTLKIFGELPGSFEKRREALNGTGGSRLEYYLSNIVYKKTAYASDKFSWLPSEFRVDDNGAVMIESYINNLHPVRHAALYPIIASVFSKFIPLLEQVLTDPVHPREPGVPFIPFACYEYQGPEPERDGIPYYEYLEDLKDWEDGATYVDPKPRPSAMPARPVSPYRFRDRRLQAIVRMSNIELTSKKASYGGKGWSVAGLDNERSIATGIFFYDVVNIFPCSLEFREPISAHHYVGRDNELHAVLRAYNITEGLSRRPQRFSQELDNVDIKNRACVVLPNTYQYKMPQIRQELKSKPGHCKMLTFYFIDPSTRIPSMEIVPPQQQDWWMEDVLSTEPFRSLPLLVVDGIRAEVDYPISLKDAKEIRLKLEAEFKKKTASASSGGFEPLYSIEYENHYF